MIPLVIQLEYYDGMVRGRRCPQGYNGDLPWHDCPYKPEAVIDLMDDLKNPVAAQTPPDNGEENAQA